MKFLFCTLLLLAVSVSVAAAKPRAASLDYCADQYLLKLADPDQILAVSRGADKDFSYMRDEATGFARIRGTLEETLSLTPDIVLRQWGGGANAENTFSRFGTKVVSLGFPEDFDGVKQNIRTTAAALDQTDRGEALIRELETRLLALSARPQSGTRTLYVTPGGVTAGAHTMIDVIITAGGAINVAAAEGLSYWPSLPAEALLLDPPEFMVAGFFISGDEDINNWSAARHPAIQKLFRERRNVSLPADMVSCAAWFSVEAAEIIANELAEPDL